jgi:hypothetical protein
MLTVQIQGESLLNDGTAIVVFMISYNMLAGVEYDALSVMTFLLEKALMAFALGLFIGYGFFGWMRLVSNRFDHSSSMIQITLTICCAYWSFILVEGVLGLSGVLGTVGSSLVLAHHMWPHVVSEESMHHVWETIESLGNIIVFFLAGSITGFIVVDIDPLDMVRLVVIYIVLLVIRATLFFVSRPLLRLLHADKKPVSWEDAVVMTWGGLRGAVGLALAIQVNNDRAPAKGADGEATLDACPQIAKKDAERLLFFVSGIAFLTTLINATTAPHLVTRLGITALPAARQKLLKMFHQQLVHWSEDSRNPPEVTESLKHMLLKSALEIDRQKVSDHGPKCSRRESSKESKELQPYLRERSMSHDGTGTTETSMIVQDNQQLCEEIKELQNMNHAITDEDLQLLGNSLPEGHLLGQVDDMIELIRNQWVDIGMAKVVNQAFLNLVYQNYWKLIEEGKLRPGSQESDVLLTSIRVSLSPYRADLQDFAYVYEKMIGKPDHDELDEEVATQFGLNTMGEVSVSMSARSVSDGAKRGDAEVGCVESLVSSSKFHIFIACVILLNSIAVLVERVARNEENDDNAAWLIFDAIFTLIFVVEFVLKITHLKWAYFHDNWNRFDFFLVIVGVLGLIMNIFTHGGDAKLADQTRVLRLARMLRTMRFLRVFRLFNAKLSADKFVSLDLAKHMKKITTMSCFITAHLIAQKDIVKYFGGNGKLDEEDESEIARCILQSQVATYKALQAAAATQRQIGKRVLQELQVVYQRKHISEGLGKFVEDAHADCAISAAETHAILHPLYHQVASCMKLLHDRAEGVLSYAHAGTGCLDRGMSGMSNSSVVDYSSHGIGASERSDYPSSRCTVVREFPSQSSDGSQTLGNARSSSE